MYLHNLTPNTLTFELRGRTHSVASGASIDVPEDLLYAVKGMGLPLTEQAPASPTVEPEQPAKAKK